MPAVDMGKLSVKLARSQRKPAEKLVSVLDFELSQWKAERSRARLLGLDAGGSGESDAERAPESEGGTES